MENQRVREIQVLILGMLEADGITEKEVRQALTDWYRYVAYSDEEVTESLEELVLKGHVVRDGEDRMLAVFEHRAEEIERPVV